MRALQEFYRIAEQQNISVDLFPLQVREALSVMDSCGDCHIAIDPGKLKGDPDERAKLAHELGHCQSALLLQIKSLTTLKKF